MGGRCRLQPGRSIWGGVGVEGQRSVGSSQRRQSVCRRARVRALRRSRSVCAPRRDPPMVDFNRNSFLSCFADVVRIAEPAPNAPPDPTPQDLSSRDHRDVMPPDEPPKGPAAPPTDDDDKNRPPGNGNGNGGSSTPSSPQQFCLRWNNYQTNLTNVFDQLLQSESFVDVTLACDGHSLKAHKMILSACSPYFQSLFFENPCQHPIVIMRDIKWPELKAAVEFMYKGEINVSQDQIGPLLRVAESLKIRGLADVNGDRDAASAADLASPSPLQKKASSSRRDDGASAPKARKRQHPVSGGGRSPGESPPRSSISTPLSSTPQSLPSSVPVLPPLPPLPLVPPMPMHSDDMEIKPGIAEMIREEERVSTPVFPRAKFETAREPCARVYKLRTHTHALAFVPLCVCVCVCVGTRIFATISTSRCILLLLCRCTDKIAPLILFLSMYVCNMAPTYFFYLPTFIYDGPIFG